MLIEHTFLARLVSTGGKFKGQTAVIEAFSRLIHSTCISYEYARIGAISQKNCHPTVVRSAKQVFHIGAAIPKGPSYENRDHRTSVTIRKHV